MKKQFTNRILIQTTVLTIAFTLALGVNYLYAWTGPSASAPTCVSGNVGCDAPVNLSANTQTKSGGLGLASLTTTGGAVVGTKLGVGMVPSNSVPSYTIDTLGSTDGGIRFPDGSVQATAAAALAPTSGVFGANATVVLSGTFNLVDVQGLNGAPNGNSTNVLTSTSFTVYKVAGTWNYTALRGGAGTAYAATSGTLTAGTQVCPVPATTGYDMKFCLTRTAGGTLQINTGAATSQGGAYKYVMQ